MPKKSARRIEECEESEKLNDLLDFWNERKKQKIEGTKKQIEIDISQHRQSKPIGYCVWHHHGAQQGPQLLDAVMIFTYVMVTRSERQLPHLIFSMISQLIHRRLVRLMSYDPQQNFSRSHHCEIELREMEIYKV